MEDSEIHKLTSAMQRVDLEPNRFEEFKNSKIELSQPEIEKEFE